jgi:hypothetical protein
MAPPNRKLSETLNRSRRSAETIGEWRGWTVISTTRAYDQIPGYYVFIYWGSSPAGYHSWIAEITRDNRNKELFWEDGFRTAEHARWAVGHYMAEQIRKEPSFMGTP